MMNNTPAGAPNKAEWTPEGSYCRYRFEAMASPCEILIDTRDETLATELGQLAEQEARRIEHKLSRYLPDSDISRINSGEAVEVDDELARLLDFADMLYRISDHLFDITSGVLRQAWHFDGSDRLPEQSRINELLSSIGWSKVSWLSPVVLVPKGMEIDLGGFGKEYAVDHVANLLQQHTTASLLVNFGGDLFASGPRSDGESWRVGLKSPLQDQHNRATQPQTMNLKQGGLATSGDRYRYLEKDGVRYSHILNPITGWPVLRAPASITVRAPTCTQAGMLATLAFLRGEGAEEFLQHQDCGYWILKR